MQGSIPPGETRGTHVNSVSFLFKTRGDLVEFTWFARLDALKMGIFIPLCCLGLLLLYKIMAIHTEMKPAAYIANSCSNIPSSIY